MRDDLARQLRELLDRARESWPLPGVSLCLVYRDTELVVIDAGWADLDRRTPVGADTRFILAEGVIHQEQPAQAIAAVAASLGAFRSPLALACIHTVTTLTGSAILALAFAHGRLDAETVWRLAHVDEDWQIEHWGTDEEAFRRRELRRQELDVAAAVFADETAR